MNGMDAIDSAGNTEKVLLIKSRKESEAGISVLIEDTGVGLTADSADKIFDPFFTTKAQGIGMGLLHQPLNRRIPRRTPMGGAASGRWYYLPVHRSCALAYLA